MKRYYFFKLFFLSHIFLLLFYYSSRTLILSKKQFQNSLRTYTYIQCINKKITDYTKILSLLLKFLHSTRAVKSLDKMTIPQLKAASHHHPNNQTK